MSRLPSWLRGSNAEVFARLILHYAPPPKRVLDCTCGYRHFWDVLRLGRGQVSIDLENKANFYDVVYSDIRKLGDVVADFRCLPFKRGSFDVLVFDPPYVDAPEADISGYMRWKPEERYAMGKGCLKERDLELFWREAMFVVKRGGLVIAKIMDTANFWHFYLWKYMRGFDLLAVHIQCFDSHWALHSDVKYAEKPIGMHAYWFIARRWSC
jgi:hypothetical protein